MRPDVTWDDLLGALPDASYADIQQAYAAKAGLLRPELLSASSHQRWSRPPRKRRRSSRWHAGCWVTRPVASGTTKRPDCGAAGEPERARRLPRPVRAAELRSRRRYPRAQRCCVAWVS